MSQKKNEGILFPTEIRVVGSYTDRLLRLLPWNTMLDVWSMFKRCTMVHYGRL